jgi:hypothetical protein
MKKVLLLIAAFFTTSGLVSANLFDEVTQTITHVVEPISHTVTHVVEPISHTVTNVVDPQSSSLIGVDSHEFMHDEHKITHEVNHQRNVFIGEGARKLGHDQHVVTHVSNHYEHKVLTKKEYAATHDIIKKLHKQTGNNAKSAEKFVAKNLAIACRKAITKALSFVMGVDCSEAIAEFAGECNAAVDGETLGLGITVCSAASWAINSQCKNTITNAIAGDVIEYACDKITE